MGFNSAFKGLKLVPSSLQYQIQTRFTTRSFTKQGQAIPYIKMLPMGTGHRATNAYSSTLRPLCRWRQNLPLTPYVQGAGQDVSDRVSICAFLSNLTTIPVHSLCSLVTTLTEL